MDKKGKFSIGQIVGLSVCAVVLIIIFLTATGLGNKLTNTPPSKSIGQEAILDSGTKVVLVAIDHTSYDEYIKAKVANDKEGITELLFKERLFAVKQNTKVRLIDTTMLMRQIRILEGEHQGKAGWVAYEYIK